MRLLRPRHARVLAVTTLFICLLAMPGTALARVHRKPCKRIRGCTVKLVPPSSIPFTGGPPQVVSQFAVAVKTAPNSAIGTGAQPGTLITNQLFGRRITCQGYAQRSPTTLAFKLRTTTPLNIDYIVSDTLTNTTAQGIQFCLAAPVAFTTLTGKPAAKTRLPDGTSGFVGLLPSCPTPSATAPCMEPVTTVPDTTNSSTGVDVIVRARVPTTTKGDPWGGS